MISRLRISALVALTALGPSVVSRAGLIDSLHNLTVSGPGPFTESEVTELCVFCHTPHNASPQRALWNRELAGIVYTLYDSSTLDTPQNQPTGTSRLCLSCHDGTVALGSLRTPARSGSTTLGPVTGSADFSTDLSDDHPVSFTYSTSAPAWQEQLRAPGALPSSIHLDSGQLHCSSCHEPHDNPFRKFLRLDDRGGALCTTCHVVGDWSDSSHANSNAVWSGVGVDPWPPGSPYTTVSDHACLNCHRPHSAPRAERLLRSSQEEDVCLDCHNSQVASRDVDSEFLKASTHPVDGTNFVHQPGENPTVMSRHVTCMDCHNPHAVTATTASPPQVPGRLRDVSGVTESGVAVTVASNEYEVCFKCHGLQDQSTPLGIVRDDNIRNVRREIDQTNPSHHPVTAIGKNPTMGGFEPGYSPTSIIYCTDCHNNNEFAGGSNPRGPHGSLYSPILEREYQLNDPTPESFNSYELCYKCHNYDFLINDNANTFLHKRHVDNNDAPCAACHDAHGSRNNPHLINFMRIDPAGTAVVSPNSVGRLEYNSLGPGAGECYLSCHGEDHNPYTYPN